MADWRALPGTCAAPFRLAVDRAGSVIVCSERRVLRLRPDGEPVVLAELSEASDVVSDGDELLVLDALAENVRKIDSQGNITTLATGLSGPSGIAVDANGNVFVSEQYENRIRKIDRAGNVTPFASKLRAPGALAFGPDGTLFVAEENRVRRIDSVGKVSDVTLRKDVRPKTFKVSCVAVDDGEGNIFVSSGTVVRRIDRSGDVTTLQGPNNRKADYIGLALHGRSTLYVSDYATGVIYAVTV